MPRNISIYVPDTLLKKMKQYQEVNWSEIARTAIEDYVSDRERAYLHNYIPFEMGDAGNIPYRLRAVLRKNSNDILFMLHIRNQSEDDLIIDRITYDIIVENEEKDIYYFTNGYILKRRGFAKGSEASFPVILQIDEKLETIINEKSFWDFSGTIYYFSKKGFLNSRFWPGQDPEGKLPELEIYRIDDVSAEETIERR